MMTAGIMQFKSGLRASFNVGMKHAGQNYALELEQMNRCILYGEKPHVTPEFSVANARLMDAVLKEIGY